MPSRLAVSAISTAWPRCSVCATDGSTWLSRACASRSRPALVVEVAFGFTISTARTLTYRTGWAQHRRHRFVRYAGFIAAAEGAVAVVVAAVLLVSGVRGAEQRIVNGYSRTAGWFAIMGGAVVTSGWALITGRRWGRGIAVFANLLLMPVAWYVSQSHQPAYAFAIAAVALTALVLLFSPAAILRASGSAGVQAVDCALAVSFGPRSAVHAHSAPRIHTGSSASAASSAPVTRYPIHLESCLPPTESYRAIALLFHASTDQPEPAAVAHAFACKCGEQARARPRFQNSSRT